MGNNFSCAAYHFLRIRLATMAGYRLVGNAGSQRRQTQKGPAYHGGGADGALFGFHGISGWKATRPTRREN